MEKVTPIFNDAAEKDLYSLKPVHRPILIKMRENQRDGLAKLKDDYANNKDQRVAEEVIEISKKEKLRLDGPKPPPPFEPPPPLTPAQIQAKALAKVEKNHADEIENFVKAGREIEAKFIANSLGLEKSNMDVDLTNDFNSTGHDF